MEASENCCSFGISIRCGIYSEKTVGKYRDHLFANKGKFEEDNRGKYKRQCLMNDENFRLQASMWVREHAYRKGEGNMTSKSFCEWVNSDLLPNSNLSENMPCSIKLRTSTRWLHPLGYHPINHKKGAYVDGHEREDVIAHRKKYLSSMKRLYDTHFPPPPPSDELPEPPPPDAETRKKNLF